MDRAMELGEGVPLTPEQNLWSSVLRSALHELGHPNYLFTREGNPGGAYKELVEWFFLPDEDFLWICAILGLDVGCVQVAALAGYDAGLRVIEEDLYGTFASIGRDSFGIDPSCAASLEEIRDRASRRGVG